MYCIYMCTYIYIHLHIYFYTYGRADIRYVSWSLYQVSLGFVQSVHVSYSIVKRSVPLKGFMVGIIRTTQLQLRSNEP